MLINRPEMEAARRRRSRRPFRVPAAIANAIFDAVGVRLREAPFTPKRVLAGLKKA